MRSDTFVLSVFSMEISITYPSTAFDTVLDKEEIESEVEEDEEEEDAQEVGVTVEQEKEIVFQADPKDALELFQID